MMLRLALGGALGGWFLGTFGGALCGVACGAVRGDISLGLDAAMWGGLVTAVAGTLYGCALGPDLP